MGQRERKAARVVFERDEAGSRFVLSHRPTVVAGGPNPDSVINVFLREKIKKHE